MTKFNLKEASAELEVLRASVNQSNNGFLTVQGKFPKKQVKADGMDPNSTETEDDGPDMEDCMAAINSLYSYVSSVQSYAYKVEDQLFKMMYQHNEGHLPPIIGAEKLNKALKVLGMDGDYKVQPKTIYASETKKGTVSTFEVECKL